MHDEQISALLRERIAACDFPSAVYVVAERASIQLADALGFAVMDKERHAAKLDTIYDLASLTKPLVTGLLAALLIERGEIKPDDSVSRYLPEFETNDKRSITLGQLLTHTSGLAAWRPLYLIADGERERALQAIARETLEAPPAQWFATATWDLSRLDFCLKD